jgi:hypothetical protein
MPSNIYLPSHKFFAPLQLSQNTSHKQSENILSTIDPTQCCYPVRLVRISFRPPIVFRLNKENVMPPLRSQKFAPSSLRTTWAQPNTQRHFNMRIPLCPHFFFSAWLVQPYDFATLHAILIFSAIPPCPHLTLLFRHFYHYVSPTIT